MQKIHCRLAVSLGELLKLRREFTKSQNLKVRILYYRSRKSTEGT